MPDDVTGKLLIHFKWRLKMEYRLKVEIENPMNIVVMGKQATAYPIVIEGGDDIVCLANGEDTAGDIAAAINFTTSIPDKIFYNFSMAEVARGWGAIIDKYNSVISALILEYEDAKAPDCEALQDAKEIKSEISAQLREVKGMLSDDTIAP